MTDELPFSQASENNKTAILEVLKSHLATSASLLEIAGGTGQHAVYFSEQLTHLDWQSSDIPSNVDNLNLRLQLANLSPALSIDVNDSTWQCGLFDAVFTANSLHIMSTSSVENFFERVNDYINIEGLLFVYGPLKYGGEFTTESNASFDLWLKDRNPVSGVRDFEWINDLATNAGFDLLEDKAMPANNQMLVWKRTRAFA